MENLGVHIPGPLSLEIRTQRSQVNDSCLKYRGNQERARRESAGVGRGCSSGGGRGFERGVTVGRRLPCQFDLLG